MVASITMLVVLAACTEEVIPTQEPVEFNPTAAVPVDRPDGSGGDTTPVEEIPVAGAGNADAGKRLFVSCSACHSTGKNQIVGPGLGGVYARADGLTGLSAEAYIEQSVREPGAYIVDGFPPVMPAFDFFTESDMQDLIAYLKTLE